jgi:hypothetical protein
MKKNSAPENNHKNITVALATRMLQSSVETLMEF